MGTILKLIVINIEIFPLIYTKFLFPCDCRRKKVRLLLVFCIRGRGRGSDLVFHLCV